MSTPPMHARRDRAESFGAVAAAYDRYRPGYPDALIDDLVALRPRSVLDIGCGTGKAARLLAARGLPVLGVEPDPGMAAIARGHGLQVELGSFERWPDGGRRFDLITAAQAWHWVDPALGAPKAARLLTEHGTLALFWNHDEPDETERAILHEVYARLAPEIVREVDGDEVGAPYRDALAATGVFGTIESRDYPWRRELPVAEYVGMVSTHSDHLQLGETRLREVRAALGAALSAAGPQVHLVGGTHLIRASGTRGAG